MKQIIKFSEVDVDGCGKNIDVLCSIESGTLLTFGTQKRLLETISSMKRELIESNETWETEELIERAMNKVFGEDSGWDFEYPDIEVTF